MIEFSCSACGKKLKVKDEHAGKKVKCPCGVVNSVPAAPAKELVEAAAEGAASAEADSAGAGDPFDFYGSDDPPKAGKKAALAAKTEDSKPVKKADGQAKTEKSALPPDSIRLTCPACGKKLKVKADSAGKKAKCPCGEQIPVPAPERSAGSEDDADQTAAQQPSRRQKDAKRIFALATALAVLVSILFVGAIGVYLVRNRDNAETEDDSAPGQKFAALAGKTKSPPDPSKVEKPRFDGLYHFDSTTPKFFIYLRFYPDGQFLYIEGDFTPEQMAQVIGLEEASKGKATLGKYSVEGDKIIAQGGRDRHIVRIRDGVLHWDRKPSKFTEVKFSRP